MFFCFFFSARCTLGAGQCDEMRPPPAERFKRSFLIAHRISLHGLRKGRPSDRMGLDSLKDIRFKVGDIKLMVLRNALTL